MGIRVEKRYCKRYDVTKGFRFIISQDNEDSFVHVSGLREHLKSRGLKSGQRVSFDVDFGMEGDKAFTVRVN